MLNKKDRPIGLLDSGVGGLTVAREVIRNITNEKIVYYGDTLHLPYGPKSKQEVKTYVYHIIDFLIKEKNVKLIVLACNTATAFVLEEAQQDYSIPIFGMLSGACRKAIKETVNKRIGIIGTKGTINSQSYQEALLNLNSNIEIRAVACPEFVELVEKGNFKGDKVEKTVHKYLDSLKESQIDALILGCTHFPYLIPVIQKIVGNKVVLVNPAVELAKEVKLALGYQEELKKLTFSQKINEHQFLVSDKKKISKLFLEKGRQFLQLPALNFVEINIFN